MRKIVSKVLQTQEGEYSEYFKGFCDSSEDKPTAFVADGSLITETDTGNMYLFSESDSSWSKTGNIADGGGAAGHPQLVDIPDGEYTQTTTIATVDIPTGQSITASAYLEVSSGVQARIFVRYQFADSGGFNMQTDGNTITSQGISRLTMVLPEDAVNIAFGVTKTNSVAGTIKVKSISITLT